jgi:hypothetical protein
MTSREKIIDAAQQAGWTVHAQPDPDRFGFTELRRTYREHGHQRTEYVTLDCGVRGGIIAITWAPGLDGFGAKSPRRDKLAWALAKINHPRSGVPGLPGPR